VEKKSEKSLTAKQEAFCQEYLIDLNATQAAIRAGYKADNAKQMGTENLSKPIIADRIAELKAERSNRTLVTADYVINGLLEVHQRCMQSEAVTERVDGQQQETGEFKFEHSGANKSLELLGKHLGIFTDKLDVRATELTHEQWLDSLND
jgi:phage terminase small subunit